MSEWDYGQGYAATTDDMEIRDGAELVRGEGMPVEWLDGNSLHVDLSGGQRVLFVAVPRQGKDLFSWSVNAGPIHLARLDRINGTTVKITLVQNVP